MDEYFPSLCLAVALVVTIATGCATPKDIKMQRAEFISVLEREMRANTGIVRVHAAEALLDNGEKGRITELFRPDAATAVAPGRIGIWRVLARAADDAGERTGFVEKIRAVLNDPKAPDRISAAESLGKLNAAARLDRAALQEWAGVADDATAAFPRWLLVLTSDSLEHPMDETALANLLESPDPVARLRAAFALGRTKNISAATVARMRAQCHREAKDSIARVYFITALMLHGDASFKLELVPYLTQGKANEQLEACNVLGLCRKQADFNLLTPLSQSREPDARIGAANGMLHLLP